MLSPLNTTTPYSPRLPERSVAEQPAQAPAGYRGSLEGLPAGKRVQEIAEVGAGLVQGKPSEQLTLKGPFFVNALQHAEAPEREESKPAAAGEPEVEGLQAADTDEDGAVEETSGELSEEELQQVDELRARDTEVRTHERAHATVGGPHAGSPRYEYERGPDGRSYATDGEVSIDTAPVSGDPAATIQKMQQVRRAALAPARPSAQDQRVAAQASQTEAQARTERAEQAQGDDGSQSPEQLPSVERAPTESAPRTATAADAQPGQRFANAITENTGRIMSQRTYARLEHGDAVSTLYGEVATERSAGRR